MGADSNGLWNVTQFTGMAQGAPTTTDTTDSGSSSGGSVWDSLFSNAGGIFSGIANVISSLNGGNTSYTAPIVVTGNGVQQPAAGAAPAPAAKSSSTWIWIVVALLVIGLVIFFIIKGGKKK